MLFLTGFVVGIWIAIIAYYWRYAQGYRDGVEYCLNRMKERREP